MSTITQVWTDLNWNDDEGLSHEFDILTYEADEKGIRHELRRSTSAEWTNPGELVVSVTEDVDDNTYTIEFDKKRKLKLDVAEIGELFAILGLMEDSKLEYRLSKPIKTIN